MGELFKLGQVVETAAVNEKRKRDRYFDLFSRTSFDRYRRGDWGDVDEEDKQSNDEALKDGERLMGVYIYDAEDVSNWLDAVHNDRKYEFKKKSEKDPDGLKLWIITEWDRSVTTLLFPSDY